MRCILHCVVAQGRINQPRKEQAPHLLRDSACGWPTVSSKGDPESPLLGAGFLKLLHLAHAPVAQVLDQVFHRVIALLVDRTAPTFTLDIELTVWVGMDRCTNDFMV